jgi:hypothetical protein
MAAHIERVVTSGPEGGGSNENNSRLIADEDQVLVVDAAHGVGQVTAAVRGRRVAIACSHGHANHVNQAPALAGRGRTHDGAPERPAVVGPGPLPRGAGWHHAR